jgi:hypothetical protein
VIILSVVFNFGFAIFVTQSSVDWPFVDLGPAVIQDSFYMRAPGLETPFGIIGDVPGGYSLYTGNPLQTGTAENMTELLGISEDLLIGSPELRADVLVLAVIFAVVPFLIIFILGRRSYGSTKTQ